MLLVYPVTTQKFCPDHFRFFGRLLYLIQEHVEIFSSRKMLPFLAQIAGQEMSKQKIRDYCGNDRENECSQRNYVGRGPHGGAVWRGVQRPSRTQWGGMGWSLRMIVKRAKRPIFKGFVVTKVSPLSCEKSPVWSVSMQSIESVQFDAL